MQIKQQDKTDHEPNINNEIDTAANANQVREAGRMTWQPNKVKSCGRYEDREDGDDGSPPILGPGIDQDTRKQNR